MPSTQNPSPTTKPASSSTTTTTTQKPRKCFYVLAKGATPITEHMYIMSTDPSGKKKEKLLVRWCLSNPVSSVELTARLQELKTRMETGVWEPRDYGVSHSRVSPKGNERRTEKRKEERKKKRNELKRRQREREVGSAVQYNQ